MRVSEAAPKIIRISSRKSDLARIQAYRVGETLLRAHPGIEIEYRFKESLGDVNQHDPLWQMPERGVFTNDFLDDLKNGETDLVVHSWKDLPTEERADTEIAGTLPRADARDLVVMKRDAFERVRREGRIRVFSSSPRRAHNLESFFKHHLPARISQVEFLPVRGNVPTRFRKLFEDGSIDALIVAKAAIDRLFEAGEGAGLGGAEESARFATVARDLREKLARCRWMAIPLGVNPSAAAQGALAIEIARGRDDLRALLSAITCSETDAQVRREREILKGHGGGCHQKIGVTVLTRPYGTITFLRGLTEKGVVLDGLSLEGATAADVPGKFAREKCWPLPEEVDHEFVERRALSVAPSQLAGHSLWIARADALPVKWKPEENALVWVAGMETWRKLASRGIWVNGSAEGLGESEPTRAEILHGRDPNWLKLTHASSHQSEIPVLATYEVLPKKCLPDFYGKEFFFWKSGTGFLRVLEANPWIAGAKHFCGPGHTYQTLRERLGPKARITIELSHSDWLRKHVSK